MRKINKQTIKRKMEWSNLYHYCIFITGQSNRQMIKQTHTTYSSWNDRRKRKKIKIAIFSLACKRRQVKMWWWVLAIYTCRPVSTLSFHFYSSSSFSTSFLCSNKEEERIIFSSGIHEECIFYDIPHHLS